MQLPWLDFLGPLYYLQPSESRVTVHEYYNSCCIWIKGLSFFRVEVAKIDLHLSMNLCPLSDQVKNEWVCVNDCVNFL